MTRTVAPRKILTEMRCKTVEKPTARAETVLVRRQVKITSESDTIERRDDGPVTRVVPRFIIVPNFLSGAFLFYESKCTLPDIITYHKLERGKQ